MGEKITTTNGTYTYRPLLGSLLSLPPLVSFVCVLCRGIEKKCFFPCLNFCGNFVKQFVYKYLCSLLSSSTFVCLCDVPLPYFVWVCKSNGVSVCVCLFTNIFMSLFLRVSPRLFLFVCLYAVRLPSFVWMCKSKCVCLAVLVCLFYT